VVRAGQGEEMRGLEDPLSLFLLTLSWGFFSASKHEGADPLLSDNWDQNSPVRKGSEQVDFFAHRQNPFLKKKKNSRHMLISHCCACHLYTINSMPKIKSSFGES
jgi:hypothetical protein